MADRIEEMGFKKFSIDEIQTGTSVNIKETDANTAYVIKSIESTQGSETNAVIATATVGLTTNFHNVQTYNKTITVAGGKFVVDGVSQGAMDLVRRSTYIFDVSDSTNATHVLAFSTTSDGSHGGGSEYTTGITRSGTPGQAGATVTFVVASDAPATLYYYCTVHSGMGGTSNTRETAESERKHSSLGTIAKAGIIGSQGSAIMDANSTLTIRPSAKTINFSDVSIFADRQDSTNPNAYENFIRPSVDGLEETTLNSNSTITPSNSGITEPYTGSNSTYLNPYNWTAFFTPDAGQASGQLLQIRSYNSNNSQSYIQVAGADNNTVYELLNSQPYARHIWDGERYIWWVYGGYLYYWDILDSNLNPTNNYHGRFYFVSGSMHNTQSSYGGNYGSIGFGPNRADGTRRRFIFRKGGQGQSYRAQIMELPDMTPYQPDKGGVHAEVGQGGSQQQLYNSSQILGSNNANLKALVIDNGSPNYSCEDYLGNGNSNYNWAGWGQQVTPTNQTDMFGYKKTADGREWGFVLWRQNGARLYNIFFDWNLMESSSYGTVIGSINNQALGFMHSSSISSLGWSTDNWSGSNNTYLTGISNGFLSTYGDLWYDNDVIYGVQGNTNSNNKVASYNLATGTYTELGSVPANRYGRSYTSFASPTTTVRQSRAYQNAPALTVRVTGIKEDRT